LVICLERGADLHMAELIPPPLTVSCFSKVQIGFTFLLPAHPGSPGKRAIKQVCVCVCYFYVIDFYNGETCNYYAVYQTATATFVLFYHFVVTFHS